VIIGVGIDVVHVERIRRWSHIEGLYDRFFHPEELAAALPRGEVGVLSLAARFAAKEAISKAFGTGIGARLGWKDMEVGRKESGEPFVILHEGGRKLLEARGGRHVLISLSHTQNYAAAVAILEGAG